MNLFNAIKNFGKDVKRQAKAMPEYIRMGEMKSNPYKEDVLTDKAKRTLRNRDRQQPQYNPDKDPNRQEQVPMPPVKRTQAQTRSRGKATPTPTQSPSPTLAQGPPSDRGRQLSVPKQYADAIRSASKKYGVPSFFLAAVLQAESNWRPDVISGQTNSRTGAQGIAQFMPGTRQDLVRRGFGEFDPLNPEEAINASAFYLSNLKEELDAPGWFHVAAAYNAGPGNYRKYGGMIPFEETRNYVNKIMDFVHSVDVKDENWLDKNTIEE